MADFSSLEEAVFALMPHADVETHSSVSAQLLALANPVMSAYADRLRQDGIQRNGELESEIAAAAATLNLALQCQSVVPDYPTRYNVYWRAVV